MLETMWSLKAYLESVKAHNEKLLKAREKLDEVN